MNTTIKLAPHVVNELKVVHKEFVDHTRWAVSFELIVEHEGKLYAVYRSYPATEYQEQDPYHTDCDGLVELIEVKAVEKLQTTYESV